MRVLGFREMEGLGEGALREEEDSRKRERAREKERLRKGTGSQREGRDTGKERG